MFGGPCTQKAVVHRVCENNRFTDELIRNIHSKNDLISISWLKFVFFFQCVLSFIFSSVSEEGYFHFSACCRHIQIILVILERKNNVHASASSK